MVWPTLGSRTAKEQNRTLTAHSNYGRVVDLTYTNLTEKFPLWREENIRELKAQFQTFDVKQDGIIDFHEL